MPQLLIVMSACVEMKHFTINQSLKIMPPVMVAKHLTLTPNSRHEPGLLFLCVYGCAAGYVKITC